MPAPRATKISVDGANVVITLSWLEKVAALVGTQKVPLDAITSVTLVPDPLRSIPGSRSPGLSILWTTKIGVWRQRGHRTLVVVRRHQRAVRLEAVGQRFHSYLIGADDAIGVESAIRAARARS